MKTALFLILAFILLPFRGYTQTATNVGTEFWIAFPPNFTNPTLSIFISSGSTTSGTITSAVPGVNQNFNVVPGIVTQLSIPNAAALSGGVEDKGIHIVSADPVSVYGLNRQGATTDAYTALPVTSLGIDYRIMSYMTTIANKGSAMSAVATQNGTVLTVYNRQTGVTDFVNLNQGQTYYTEQPTVGEDLTGSRIQSNFPVSVFSGSRTTNVPTGCAAADHIIEQMWPVNSWGKNFVTVPTAGRDASGDLFRVLAAEDGTVVSLNGTVVSTLNTAEFYEAILTGFNSITTTKAVCLAQFAKGMTCSGNLTGDPFMLLIPPQEQFLINYTVATVSGFATHWANIVAPDYALGTIFQDGILIPNGAFTQISTTNYYGAQRSISEGSHTFNSTFPFGVFMYGWNIADSYGYPGGGSLSPVGTVDSVSLSPATASGILDVTTICLTAHVMDNFLNPVEGVLVNFIFSGLLGQLTGNAFTDAAGNAQYCYMRMGTTPGIDSVYAEIFGFVSDTSIVYWSYVPPCTNPTAGGTIDNAQTGCSGFIPSAITSPALPSGQSGTLEYKWQESVVSAGSGFSDITSSNSATWTPGALTQTTWFRRLARVDCMADWTGAAISNVVEMTVNPWILADVSIAASANPVCPGTPVTFTATPVNPGSTPAYQWMVNGMNTGLNNAVFTFTPTTGDTVQCFMTSSLACITVNPTGSNKIGMSSLPMPVVTFTPCFDTITRVDAKSFKLKGGIPLGGIYSGPGVNSSTGIFTPSAAGTGTKTITYTYTNAVLCSDTRSVILDLRSATPFACGNELTDIRDGKKYSTMQVGSQCWMAANLDFGLQISDLTHQRDNCIVEKYCLNNTSVNCEVRGANYQWDELMRYDDTPAQQGLCPPGWHVPTEAEWDQLFANWTDNGFAAAPLKYSGYSGFNAVLSGVWHQNVQWDYQNFATFFWSSTAHGLYKAWAHGMNDPDPSVALYPSLRSNAFSVRCILD